MQRLELASDSDTDYSMITKKDESVTKKKESMTKKEWGNDQSKQREAKQFFYKKTRLN